MTPRIPRDLDVRPPTLKDAPGMAALMVRGNATYREWAPRFWRPPGVGRTQSQWILRLRDEERWTRIAVGADEGLVALASWRPAGEHGAEGAPAPGVGYVSHLYVDPARCGHGIGRGLLAHAEDAMRALGNAAAMLWTPTGARARGFYERCGWRRDGRERWSTELQLPMVGYAKVL